MSRLDLDKYSYTTPKIAMLSWSLLAVALGSAIASHYGSYPHSLDMCFYPVAAQKRDAKIEQLRIDNLITEISDKSPQPSLGTKHCNPKRGDIGTIPASYIKKAHNGSLNDRASELAPITQGLRGGWLKQVSEVPAENPFKIPFGAGAIVLGTGAIFALKKQQDQAGQLRPMYRATQRGASLQAGYALALHEGDLKLSAELMLNKLRGLRESDARIMFARSVTDEQAHFMLQAMDEDDYHSFGYLLDNGVSFNKFLAPATTQEVQLEAQPDFVAEPVANQPPDGEPVDKVEYTKTADMPRADKYEPYRQIGLQILQQAGTPGKCKAIVAPSRTGKTTVLYFMLEESYRVLGDNLTCYVWQGKGIEPIHPNIPRKNHSGFTLKEFNFDALDAVWEEYELRQELLEQGHRNFAPTLLIITDWQSIKDQISSFSPKEFKEIQAKLMTLINNGAALGTTIWLDSQSPSIDEWGLGSSSIRDNFDIFAIARIGKDKSGVPMGDTKCITKMVNNPYLVPGEKDRVRSLEQFGVLVDGMESGQIKTSVILSTAGIVRLGITPEFERKVLQFQTKQPASDSQPTDTPKEVERKPKEPLEFPKPNPSPEPLPKPEDKVRSLLAEGKNYRQICEILGGKHPIKHTAAILGSMCRIDKIDILSVNAKSLLDVLRGEGWIEIDSSRFTELVSPLGFSGYDLATYLEELELLTFTQVKDGCVRALY
ncbi:hypothetical protein kac65v162_gp140 [Nodularia phage vB_NspS-kac65v162]|jgi:hypothetical protein|uniref:Uncharacterized protein n=1 Tax=Nodularia phage vB_NspS-kac65v162 TaxID=2557581 RepID=A0A482MIJ4_9CAUD|nr:hypothetical protein kac65v162_gp140 [Nodularia phage vB_NspS-kac65v162]